MLGLCSVSVNRKWFIIFPSSVSVGTSQDELSQMQLYKDEQPPKHSHRSRWTKEKLEQNSAGGNKYIMYYKWRDPASLLQTVSKGRLASYEPSVAWEDEQWGLKRSQPAGSGAEPTSGPFGLTGGETWGGEPHWMKSNRIAAWAHSVGFM